MFARFLPLVLASLTCLVAASACLDIEQTPPSASGGSGGGGSSGGASNEGGSGFTPTPCLKSCIDRKPDGASTFLAVAACNSQAVLTNCAKACAEGGEDDGGSVCPVPGTVDPSPPCNACIKRTCCAELQRCSTDGACITVGICASGCE